MKIDGINPYHLNNFNQVNKNNENRPSIDFSNQLNDALQRVDDMQKEADRVGQDFLLGKTDSVHKVTVAMEEAQLAYDLTLTIRDRILEGYRELMRMQF